MTHRMRQDCQYEQRGDRVVVLKRTYANLPVGAEMPEHSVSGTERATAAEKQLLEVPQEMQTMKAETSTQVAEDVLKLMFAVMIFWIIMHGIFY